SGDYLIALMGKSEIVLEAVLNAAGRRDLAVARRVLDAHSRMVEVMALFERERIGQKRVLAAARRVQTEAPTTVLHGRLDGLIGGRSDRDGGVPLNRRQRWYLDGLAAGRQVRAVDLQRRWRV